MEGKTFNTIDVSEDEIIFRNDVEEFRFYHDQDCCEHVYIESVVGEIKNLIGTPLTLAEEVSNYEPEGNHPYGDYSHTWTFYKFATVKGYVDVRWLGESNGYYSERVDMEYSRRESNDYSLLPTDKDEALQLAIEFMENVFEGEWNWPFSSNHPIKSREQLISVCKNLIGTCDKCGCIHCECDE